MVPVLDFLTYKDSPLDKRGLRRPQICHLVRWVRTAVTWASCFTHSVTELVILLYLWEVNKDSVLLGGKAVDQPVPGCVWGRPWPGAGDGGPVGAGSIRWRRESFTAQRHLLPVRRFWFDCLSWRKATKSFPWIQNHSLFPYIFSQKPSCERITGTLTVCEKKKGVFNLWPHGARWNGRASQLPGIQELL